MEIRYRRDARRHEIALSGGSPVPSGGYACRMVRENRIEGFLPCRIEHLDDETIFLYDVTSHQPMRELCEAEEVGEEGLRAFLLALRGALQALEAYLLPQDGIALSPDCIFADGDGRQFSFCYYPGNDSDLQRALKQVSEYLLSHLSREDRDAIVLGYSFYRICARGELTEQALGKLLYDADGEQQAHHSELVEQDTERDRILDRFFADEEEEEGADELGRKIPRGLIGAVLAACAAAAAGLFFGRLVVGIGAAVVILAGGLLVHRRRAAAREEDPDAQYDLWEDAEEDRAEIPAGQDAVQAVETDETEGSGRLAYAAVHAEEGLPDEAERGETMLLADLRDRGTPSRGARLVPIDPKSGSVIGITQKRCRIGKRRGDCEICLGSEAVSRMHARLEWDGETYQLFDLRSRNGTFLNETILEAGTGHPLRDGDCVRFADMAFHYELC